MGYAKVAVSLEQELVKEVDRLVKNRKFDSRSQFVQQALKEKISRLHKTRLARELAKLTDKDRREFQAFADEGLQEDLKSWPEY